MEEARAAGEPWVSHDRGYPALLVGGVVQSVTVELAVATEYWPAMLPDARPERALLLGAGGGTLAALLTRRFGRVRIVAVDNDARVVQLGREAFYLSLSDVDVVLADAFAFAAACTGLFDYIAVDLFHGGERPRAMLSRPFLADLRRLSAPRATVAVNLFRDKRLPRDIARLERGLTVLRRVDAGRNVVLHCRGR